ncbi:hypothetical protein [Halobacteriovorax sp. JY17]|uniref:hypothetical protein n=1 Tax=Halobacteriovorax sp. JY17 TaxID=2014617 RepID=UPI0025B7E233|nr:hypothetical protein [Halobacteriovorax sp. JY17]
MNSLKKLIAAIKLIFSSRDNSYELQTYMDLEMRKVSNLDDKNFNDKLLKS